MDKAQYAEVVRLETLWKNQLIKTQQCKCVNTAIITAALNGLFVYRRMPCKNQKHKIRNINKG